MTSQNEVFLDDLDLLIQSKHLLNHPFYQAWSRGELSLNCLKIYAREYYQHVKAFPTYLSAIHSRTAEPATRKALLKNLIEEEAGAPNHPELWKNFAMALGCHAQDLQEVQPQPAIASLIAIFRNIATHKTTAEGLASLYAYESQIPAVCISKIAGLKTHYGMRNPKAWEYFSVHIAADKEHAAEERLLLKAYITPHNREAIRTAVDNVLDGLWNFLSTL